MPELTNQTLQPISKYAWESDIKSRHGRGLGTKGLRWLTATSSWTIATALYPRRPTTTFGPHPRHFLGMHRNQIIRSHCGTAFCLYRKIHRSSSSVLLELLFSDFRTRYGWTRVSANDRSLPSLPGRCTVKLFTTTPLECRQYAPEHFCRR